MCAIICGTQNPVMNVRLGQTQNQFPGLGKDVLDSLPSLPLTLYFVHIRGLKQDTSPSTQSKGCHCKVQRKCVHYKWLFRRSDLPGPNWWKVLQNSDPTLATSPIQERNTTWPLQIAGTWHQKVHVHTKHPFIETLRSAILCVCRSWTALKKRTNIEVEVCGTSRSSQTTKFGKQVLYTTKRLGLSRAPVWPWAFVFII